MTAREFLSAAPSAGTKCYCRCKLTLDKRSALGWSVSILEIRKTDWKEIRAVLDHLGRRDLEDPTLFSSM